jgi:hypothetical protein
MLKRVAEFENKNGEGRDGYAFGGLSLERLRDVPVSLRHEARPHHEVFFLFGRTPEDRPEGPQIFLSEYALPEGAPALAEQLAIYPKAGFRLPKGVDVKVDEHFLAPAHVEGFSQHEVFLTRDGRFRRRVVHLFQAEHSAVLLVYSLNGNRFAGYPFFVQIAERLGVKAARGPAPVALPTSPSSARSS